MKNKMLSSLFIMLLVILAFCKPIKPEGEGITGKVTWLEGNQMPMIVEDGEKPEVNPKGVPVQRTLIIYPMTNLADAKVEGTLFQSISGEPITTVTTDEEGRYLLELAPGRYSIFTREEDGLFANIFDGDGNIQPVTVKKGEWTLLDIVINYKAVF
ncbi:MAG TPA: hypothetical protein DEQ87_11925 [Algoriphagus sp.]|jgi:hypothetical protein|uniref:carboxypeptidase regulatory-like domain-containing protein n=1 Tax=unclassified Algoriphagus TaxID=2641541 RepID=UPI000C568A85|nr:MULTISPECIES: carboxypeptidase regulatory-like domain-containing protein [unclassified Algoriphagus]MAL13074.1 hypothetical protein [Algoriphagus sp.]MAN85840.1 hypothetical protein [Algoriphagus sp.]HAD53239.1 hypothetical protein [Algoriphagus sp.]HAS57206.1 hypothetical protein [Algoriphagus sp.]HAZ24702.1 hypothetical protein [Algoriphagus sp.]|tara:strand:+ start:1180 stop:1647 length:468 start_codon:yes stop_codon:yes gene_type:complete